MRNKTLSIFVLFTVLSLALVSSAPPFQTNTNTANGLQVFAPQFEAVKYNETFKLHVHLSNLSNGVPLPNTYADCYLHLYSMNGGHLYESEALEKDSNGWDFEAELLYSNFTEHGEFNGYYIWCNNTAQDLGGELKGVYEVTANGKPAPEGIVIICFGALLLFILSVSVTYMLKSIGHVVEMNFDLMDVGIMWGMYFALLGVHQLAGIYLGSVVVNDWLDLFVVGYAFPMVIVPVIAFLLTLFRIDKAKKRKAQQW